MRAHGHWPIKFWLALTAASATATSGFALFTATATSVASEIILTNGTPIGEYSEGTPRTNQLVAEFTDSGNAPIVLTRPSAAVESCNAIAGARYTATIDWLGNGTDVTDGVVSCANTPGVFQVSGDYTYKDSGIFNIKVTVTDTVDQPNVTASGTTDTAAVADRSLTSRAGASVTGTEGGTVHVSAAFFDSNPAYDATGNVDPGLTATIDWGDGTTSAADRIEWPDSSDQNVLVTGSHAYDANKVATPSYTVKVTLHDDGTPDATRTLHATIADAALSAAGSPKSFTATASAATSPVVASFTDAAAAQAAVGDFTASITWGDSSTSAGTITKTATGFDVGGSHTYASAGTKSLGITVTDEEGQTLTVSATATVGAAPVVLPLTGQPKLPVAPMSPFLALVLAMMGMAGGIAGIMSRRVAR
ncbi:MAG TPA: hypothetical protein VIO62_08255 [Candidatus Dormibacteraeota bacterium]